jgi:hypothetical protein
MIGAALWFTWWWLGRRENLTSPPRKSRAEILKALRDSTWALMLPIIILVGLRMGVFTPTEAAVYALFVATVVYRELKFSQLTAIFVTAAKTTAVVMFLVAAAMVSAWLITVADLPSKVIGLLEPFMGNPTLLPIAIMLLCMAVGTAMDMTPTILILTPVLMPVIKAAGIDPVYDGIELFEPDFTNARMSAAEPRRQCDDLGLKVELFQPFCDFEGMPRESFERSLLRAEKKFDLMEALGCPLVLVCSNTSPLRCPMRSSPPSSYMCWPSAPSGATCASASRRWPGAATSTSGARPGTSCSAAGGPGGRRSAGRRASSAHASPRWPRWPGAAVTARRPFARHGPNATASHGQR